MQLAARSSSRTPTRRWPCSCKWPTSPGLDWRRATGRRLFCVLINAVLTGTFNMNHLRRFFGVFVATAFAGFVNASETEIKQAEVHFPEAPAATIEGSPNGSQISHSSPRGGVRPFSSTAAPAPGLSYLQITNVGSSNVGWELVSAMQTTTAFDHGGMQLRVVTDEIGYGNLPIARHNGAVLPSSANYATQQICWNGSTYIIPCSPGQTVAGWRRYWNLDAHQNGTFSYQNTSTNSPWNTLSDSLWIK